MGSQEDLVANKPPEEYPEVLTSRQRPQNTPRINSIHSHLSNNKSSSGEVSKKSFSESKSSLSQEAAPPNENEDSPENEELKFLDINSDLVSKTSFTEDEREERDESDYDGLKPNSKYVPIGKEENKKNNKNQSENQIYKIKWRIKNKHKDENIDVKIVGSFSMWKQKFSMIKNKENGDYYEINLNLPYGKNEFKFIVNGEWKCSPDYQIIKDGNGNENNFIMINEEIAKEEKEEERKKKSDEPLTSCETNKQESINSSNIKKKGGNRYGNVYPLENESNNSGMGKVPELFCIKLNLNDNSNQKYICNKSNKKYLDIRHTSLSNCYKNITELHHIYKEHLFTKGPYSEICEKKDKKKKKKIIKNKNFKKEKKTYLSTNCIERISGKNVAFVYYRPITTI